MKSFLDDNFLLHSETAILLYNEYAKNLPIIDYHNHLAPDEIAENKQFKTITEVWLKGDHYKWRAMRAYGIEEKYITGSSTTDKEKFLKWAETVPHTIRNPLYHWTHLELQRYFGIYDLLSPSTAEKIYDQCNAALAKEENFAQGLLTQMNVEVVCTTDDPTDDLNNHEKHRTNEEAPNMLPTYRPDKLVVIDGPHFLDSLSKLEKCVGYHIDSFDQYMSAMKTRMDYFESLGCKLSDHGLSHLHKSKLQSYSLDDILSKRKNNKEISEDEVAFFIQVVMVQLAEMYHAKGWTMQLHLGAIRNNNSRLLQQVGADVGCDSIGDYEQAATLSAFLDALDKKDKLTKSILYNLNPRDNEVFATMAGNFNDGSAAGKVQWGSAWWFLDQKDGMEKQINALSNMGLLSQFVGMLTDSRSFLSFPRHEYFRRILCNLIATDVENGEIPFDEKLLGGLVSDLCYHNAKRYFNFQTQNRKSESKMI